jgi:hypothetical protein
MIAIRGKEAKNNCHISQAEADIMRQYITFFIRFLMTGHKPSSLPSPSSRREWIESCHACYIDFLLTG